MAEHLLKLLAVTKTFIREAQRTQSRISTKQAKNDPSTSYLNHRPPNRKRKQWKNQEINEKQGLQ